MDVAVVGGGPAGLSAALVLGRARRDVVLFDIGPGRNHRAAEVHNLLSRDGITPADLRERARVDLRAYPSVQVVPAEVRAVRVADGGFVLTTDADELNSARVILATGVRDVLPDIPGVAENWGTGVLHCPYCHGWEYRDLPLAVLVNDFESAFLALRLATGFSPSVTAVTQSDELDDGIVAMLADADVKVGGRLEAVHAVAGSRELEAISLADGSSVAAAALFLKPRLEQASPIPASLGCRVLADGLLEVDAMQQTSVSGVYAAGDLARQSDRPYGREMVAVSASEGLQAGVFVDQDLLLSRLG